MSRNRLVPLAVAGAVLIAAMGTIGTAQAQAQARGKVAIFIASNTFNLVTLVQGEGATKARVFDQPVFDRCYSIRRSSSLGPGGHNLLNLTNGYVTAYTDTDCGTPTPSIALPPLGQAGPNQGIHIDFANSFKVRRSGGLLFFGSPVTLDTSLASGLKTGSVPAYDAPLQFMPTPDGQLAADTSPGEDNCKLTNPLVHNLYNTTAKWVYFWIDWPLCVVSNGTVPPGSIQHLFLGLPPTFGYTLSPEAPVEEPPTAAVRAACKQKVSKSASRRVRTQARRDVKNCQLARMYNLAAAKNLSKRSR